MAHGHGVLVEARSQGVFEGLWIKGDEVSGVYSWPSGKQYSGEWKNQAMNGLGVETRADDIKYSGEFTQNMMGPLGVLDLPGHGVYIGTWGLAGVQEGEGVEGYADGGKTPLPAKVLDIMCVLDYFLRRFLSRTVQKWTSKWLWSALFCRTRSSN